MEQDFTLWLEFEAWEQLPHHDLEDDFFNMNIFMSDGTVYALTVWTFRNFLTHVEDVRKERGARSRYLEPPCLFVERLDRGEIEETVKCLIADESLSPDWIVPEEDREFDDEE